MNFMLLGLKFSSTKKLIGLVLATMAVVVSLPIGAVFALSNLPLLVVNQALSPFSSTGSVYAGEGDPEILAGYDFGNCTYWAALQRKQAGDPIPYNWGNALTWNTNAVLTNYVVDHSPTVNSVFQWPGAPGDLGHVAYVKAVDIQTGAWTISEMNALGFNVTDERTYPASAAASYNFIHDRKDSHDLQVPQPLLDLHLGAFSANL